MNNKKIMFFDIDGTLLPSGENKINDNILKRIGKAREKGNLMFINTGRTLANLDDNILKAGFDGFVCACGSYIIIDDKVVYYKQTNNKVCQSIRAEAHNCNVDIVYESCHGIYYEPGEIKLKKSLRLIQDLQKSDMISAISYRDNLSFDKFVIFKRPASNLTGFLKTSLEWFDCIERGNNFYEFVPKGCSKATGIQFILNYFNLPLSSAHAIGDSTNDLPMLKYVPHSIAMGNSNPKSLFNDVEFVTKNLEDNGVIYALDHYGF